ncbi:MAG: hypothetical protein IJA61_03390 [Clostridia bacterium]|nr:hypothetical protein [Clostridia bacterium]
MGSFVTNGMREATDYCSARVNGYSINDFVKDDKNYKFYKKVLQAGGELNGLLPAMQSQIPDRSYGTHPLVQVDGWAQSPYLKNWCSGIESIDLQPNEVPYVMCMIDAIGTMDFTAFAEHSDSPEFTEHTKDFFYAVAGLPKEFFGVGDAKNVEVATGVISKVLPYMMKCSYTANMPETDKETYKVLCDDFMNDFKKGFEEMKSVMHNSHQAFEAEHGTDVFQM